MRLMKVRMLPLLRSIMRGADSRRVRRTGEHFFLYAGDSRRAVLTLFFCARLAKDFYDDAKVDAGKRVWHSRLIGQVTSVDS